MKISGAQVSNELLLLAHAVDRLSILVWQNTKDGQKGRNKPDSIAEKIIYGDNTKRIKTSGYATPEAFRAAYQKIIERR